MPFSTSMIYLLPFTGLVGGTLASIIALANIATAGVFIWAARDSIHKHCGTAIYGEDYQRIFENGSKEDITSAFKEAGFENIQVSIGILESGASVSVSFDVGDDKLAKKLETQIYGEGVRREIGRHFYTTANSDGRITIELSYKNNYHISYFHSYNSFTNCFDLVRTMKGEVLDVCESSRSVVNSDLDENDKKIPGEKSLESMGVVERLGLELKCLQRRIPNPADLVRKCFENFASR